MAAETVVNATGVWTDEVRTLEDGTVADTIRPAKGVHLTLPWALVRNDIAAVIPVPGDKRSLFVVPWGPLPDGTFRHTYIGTTDTDYAGPLDDPPCTSEDIDYVLGAVNAAIGADIGARRRHRRVGRPAAAGARRAAVVAPPICPAVTA